MITSIYHLNNIRKITTIKAIISESSLEKVEIQVETPHVKSFSTALAQLTQLQKQLQCTDQSTNTRAELLSKIQQATQAIHQVADTQQNILLK
tara:strand:- start:3 stop:281 length:279 start_codon:yes stop_codon:yes gene_type:complete